MYGVSRDGSLLREEVITSGYSKYFLTVYKCVDERIVDKSSLENIELLEHLLLDTKTTSETSSLL